jgi:hypothetical protein
MAKASRNIKPRAVATAADRQLLQPQDDGPSSSVPRGDYTLNPRLRGVSLERFSSIWSEEGTKAAFRVWNNLDESDPKNSLYRGRLGPQMEQLGGMSFFGPVVVAPFIGIGANSNVAGIANPKGQKSTFIVTKQAPRVRSLKWKKNVMDVIKEGVPFWELPYPSFYDACTNAFKAGNFASGGRWDAQWNSLMSGGTTMSPIPDMKTRYFMVGHFYELGKDLNTKSRVVYGWDGKQKTTSIVERNGVPFGLGESDPLVVAWMSGNAGEKVLDLCKTLKEEWTGDEDANPAVSYKYGDPCGVYNKETGGVDGGLIFTMFNPEKYQPPSHEHSTWNGHVPAPTDFSSYHVSVSRTYKSADGTTYKGDLSPEDTKQIFAKNLYPWPQDGDDEDTTLLHEVSVEEEAVLIAKGFVDIPDLLKFAWTSHPEYLEFDEVRSILGQRTTVAMPDVVPSEPAPEPAPSPHIEAAVAGDNDPNFGEDFGGELEAEEVPGTPLTAEGDDEFAEFAQSFVPEESFEEDSSASSDFDPDTEADELSASMGDSLSKASKALANSAKRTSPRRKLNPPS